MHLGGRIFLMDKDVTGIQQFQSHYNCIQLDNNHTFLLRKDSVEKKQYKLVNLEGHLELESMYHTLDTIFRLVMQ